LADPAKILLIRPSALGDVCRTVPVVAALHARYPQARIEWMVQQGFEDAVRHHPAVDAIVPFNRKALGKQILKGDLAQTRAFLRSLRDAGYDMVLDAQGLARSGVFMWATRARVRVGYRQAQEGAWLAANRRADAPRDLHTVDRMLRLAAAAGADVTEPDMRLFPDPDALSQVIIEHPEPYAVLAPTSRWASKRWPDERFAAVARTLLDERLVERVLIVGAPGEREQCPACLALAADHPRVTDRVGSTTVAALMALISRASLVIANDSAAVHMAVGFDRPTVALYGPTDVARVGPYRRDADVIRHRAPGDPIDHKDDANRVMMERITTEEVLAAARARLQP
jgi:lipopolysaccharide heptosyltransferase I